MAKTAKKTAATPNPNAAREILFNRLKLAILIVVGAFAMFLLLALFTYSPEDPGFSVAQTHHGVQNGGGIVGAYIADFVLVSFGFFGYIIPFLVVYGLWVLYAERDTVADKSLLLGGLRWLGALINFLAGAALCAVLFAGLQTPMPQGNGGIVGQFISVALLKHFNFNGTLLLLGACFILGLTLFSGLLWIRGIYQVVCLLIRGWARLWQGCCHGIRRIRQKRSVAVSGGHDSNTKKARAVPGKEKEDKQAVMEEIARRYEQEKLPEVPAMEAPADTAATGRGKASRKKQQAPAASDQSAAQTGKGKQSLEVGKKASPSRAAPPQGSSNQALPAVTLLDEATDKPASSSRETLEALAREVEARLADFGIKAEVAGVYPGPVVTLFELQLAAGVKASKLTSLAQDLARSLSTSRVRVVEVIPGKPYVGLELPNQTREMVRIREIICSEPYARLKTPLALVLGKDISGNPEVANLDKMPHLLVAGTTGSGKSVGVNAMILSMLYKAGPEDLRLILIDPKMLELSIYEGIPHLLAPVVTDMNEAASALRWCVKEMDRRYELMSLMGVRNIAGLNDKIAKASGTDEPVKDPIWIKQHPGRESEAPLLEKLSHIVVVADEFADMMMVVGKKVEELIARLAQKARAAGIHLILATQRPSVDVVTGLIKANIPARIAFQVSSRVDSRTILDQQGAEQLLGHGDMLYLPPGTATPKRVHGAFVEDEEVHRVVAALKQQGQPEYIESILNTQSLEEGDDSEQENGEQDALYDQAVQIVIDTQRPSISSLQRRLRIGYNRAARLIEDMEKAGVVSEMQSNGMREVLVKR